MSTPTYHPTEEEKIKKNKPQNPTNPKKPSQILCAEIPSVLLNYSLIPLVQPKKTKPEPQLKPVYKPQEYQLY